MPTLLESPIQKPDLVKYPWVTGLDYLGRDISIAHRRLTRPENYGDLQTIHLNGNHQDFAVAEILSNDSFGRLHINLARLLGYSGICERFDMDKLVRDTEEANRESRERGSSGYVSLSRVDDSFNLFFVTGPIDPIYESQFFGCHLDNVQNVPFENIRQCSILRPAKRTI